MNGSLKLAKDLTENDKIQIWSYKYLVKKNHGRQQNGMIKIEVEKRGEKVYYLHPFENVYVFE